MAQDKLSHHYTTVNGIKLHYVRQGAGEPLLLIHGWPGFWYEWHMNIGPLAQHFDVIVPDMRGFAYSDKPDLPPEEGYTDTAFAEDIRAFIDFYHFDRVRIVSHDFGAAWVQIDEPKFRFSIRQNYLPNVKGFYYMRLHGRNAAKWWRHDKSEDRYDYLYSEDELKEFTETASAARELVKKAYLYTNNHFAAKSVANAAMIKRQLGEPIEGEYPPEFVERFPQLAGAVNVQRTQVGRLL